jgi:hypothetical protein
MVVLPWLQEITNNPDSLSLTAPFQMPKVGASTLRASRCCGLRGSARLAHRRPGSTSPRL